MKSNTFFFLFLAAAAIPSFSIPLETLVPARAAWLRSSDSAITQTQLRNPSLGLLPEDANLRQAVLGHIRGLDPGILVETLYLYKKPENAHTSASDWNSVQKTGIYNQLLAISSLAGIQYYSDSRSAMRTFFETSRVIDNPDTKNPLPDPVYPVPPAALMLYARQKDLTFGDNIYQYNYTVTPSCIYFVQENITPLSYGLVRVIGRNNLKTILTVFDCGDSLLIYGVSMAKAVSVPGMGDRIGNSFSNRADAMLSWFTGRANLMYSGL